MEYSGEEQAICAVGLVRPRPGVFVEAIQYVLVLCTTVEVRRMPVLRQNQLGATTTHVDSEVPTLDIV